MDWLLPLPAQHAITRLEAAGFPTYAVGGWVRDQILGIPCHDVDLATAATPQHMRDVFAGFPLIPTGEAHGTLTVLVDGMPLEMTTFRKDGEYVDHRRPLSVDFTHDLEQDLARRDFTISAMAYHPQRGLIDPFGGQDDLASRILRAVGDPEKRFQEDALRILRGVRFAARFGLTIEENTANALLLQKHLLSSIAVERVFSELVRMDITRLPTIALPILQVVIPELTHLPQSITPSDDPAERLASLLAGLPARTLLTRLRAPNMLIRRVHEIVENIPTCTLVINGYDCLARSMSRAQIGKALQHLRQQVWDGVLPNERDALLAALDNLCAEGYCRKDS